MKDGGINVVFFGSGPFGLPALERLARPAAGHRLLRVVTRPARPAGRGHRVSPTPVGARARELGLACDAPVSVNEPGCLAALASLAPDLFVVADYGEILGKPFRELPRLGAFNLHASLLPRWRGAAPVAYALLAGDRRSGVTLFRIVRELDSGPIVDAEAVDVGELETAGELEARLSLVAADLLERNLAAFAAGSFRETPQEESLATRAPKLERTAGRIDWTAGPEEIANRVRALNPWPGAYSFLERAGKEPERTVFLRVRPAGAPEAGPGPGPAPEPGRVTRAAAGRLQIACGGGEVEVLAIQRAGGARLDAASYLRGRALAPGDRFGPEHEHREDGGR